MWIGARPNTEKQNVTVALGLGHSEQREALLPSSEETFLATVLCRPGCTQLQEHFEGSGSRPVPGSPPTPPGSLTSKARPLPSTSNRAATQRGSRTSRWLGKRPM